MVKVAALGIYCCSSCWTQVVCGEDVIISKEGCCWGREGLSLSNLCGIELGHKEAALDMVVRKMFCKSCHALLGWNCVGVGEEAHKNLLEGKIILDLPNLAMQGDACGDPSASSAPTTNMVTETMKSLSDKVDEEFGKIYAQFGVLQDNIVNDMDARLDKLREYMDDHFAAMDKRLDANDDIDDLQENDCNSDSE